MSDALATRPQRIASMREAMAELDRAGGSMRGALQDTNDETHHAFFSGVLDRLAMIVANERADITFTLADDLTNVRSAIRRLRLPDIDPELDMPTQALKALRAERGNLIEAIDNALDAAALLRLHPRAAEFGTIRIERHEVAEKLIRFDERLRIHDESIADLKAEARRVDEASGANAISQTSLVNFHVQTLQVEVNAARFETRVCADGAIPGDVDIAALARSIEAMKEIADDLKQTVQGLGNMMVDSVRVAGAVVVKTAERSWQGLKTVVTWVRRRLNRPDAAGDIPKIPEAAAMPDHVERMSSVHPAAMSIDAVGGPNTPTDIEADPVTGCYTGDLLTRMVEREVARAGRAGRALAILMIDLAAPAGAEAPTEWPKSVVLEMTKLIRLSVRTTDVLGQFQPGELALLLPDTPTDHAPIVAAKLLKRLEDAASIPDAGHLQFRLITARQAEDGTGIVWRFDETL